MKRRVVITGLGTVNPLGNSVRDAWGALCAGRSGISPITKFDAADFQTRIAGELKHFDALQFVNKKERRRYDDFIIYALAGAEMALADAGLSIGDGTAERTGVIVGSGIGGLATIEKLKETLQRQGPGKLSPFAVPSVLANLAAGHVSIRFGAKGPINCTVTACAAGTNAIGEALWIIQRGHADAMIAGGTEAAICPLTIAGFNAMRALSVRNDLPEAASRPFDRDRDGFVIGEGCGILILEELGEALKRGARIYAEIAGFGLTSDAFHMAAPPPGHEGAARSMRLALQDAGMAPEEIDYINAHGTSTPLNDLYETQAIKAVFGPHSRNLLVSSTKSMTGHLLGGAGGVEAIVCAMAIQDGVIPPTINLDHPDAGCDLDYVPHRSRKREVRAALSNTFGFGGVNAVLLFRKFTG
ncbi:MAG TPA: beta-ketoacyl-ACP synthase II [Syntrophales bacterium]|nr:beta-ketoacyl-ACP synthase II [Syntrophales bacterium]HOX94602.1 beta-ketoacyl-ACP synthase II [Syntrophales bacterium]HPI58033.1 beta-ketoacyl-ACP synthase II [Syntrophales bacterium]HPN25249.1 beta-ketoacyl-ACP synthase II [Syntrophales bacterium]HQM29332.1 beta-ketoacyl-ACP synthase II [Syntrophales bacterium]